MSNVHHLPDSMQRQWRVFEGLLKQWLATEGCTVDEIDYACAQSKSAYLRFAQRKQFSGDPETVLEELNEWVKVQITGLIQTIAVRDVELFRLRGR